MNLKIALAAVLLISGGAYVSNAQTRPVVATVSTAKTFEKKLAAYEKETDATKSAAILSGLKQEMIAGMSSLKNEIGAAGAKGDQATVDQLMNKNELRTSAFREVMQLSRPTTPDKIALISAFKKYGATL